MFDLSAVCCVIKLGFIWKLCFLLYPLILAHFAKMQYLGHCFLLFKTPCNLRLGNTASKITAFGQQAQLLKLQ